MQPILKIGTICRILRRTSKPPIQTATLAKVYGRAHASHVANIESGQRQFPLKRIDAIIEAFGQEHNQGYIRYCAYVNNNHFQFYNDEMPPAIKSLIALKYSGLLTPEALEEITAVIHKYVPTMPEDIQERVQEAAKNGLKR